MGVNQKEICMGAKQKYVGKSKVHILQIFENQGVNQKYIL